MTHNYHAPLEKLGEYTKQYHDLFKDACLRKGFDSAITGIIESGSTKVSQIARLAPQTSQTKYSEKRTKLERVRFRGHEGRFQNEIGDYDVKANENIHPRI